MNRGSVRQEIGGESETRLSELMSGERISLCSKLKENTLRLKHRSGWGRELVCFFACCQGEGFEMVEFHRTQSCKFLFRPDLRVCIPVHTLTILDYDKHFSLLCVCGGAKLVLGQYSFLLPKKCVGNFRKKLKRSSGFCSTFPFLPARRFVQSIHDGKHKICCIYFEMQTRPFSQSRV